MIHYYKDEGIITNFPRKELRTKPIIDYVKQSGYDGIVCFSCGNATRALKKACNVEGIYLLGISPYDALSAREWWSMAEIHKAFPVLFDATSGHLPFELMSIISGVFKDFIGELKKDKYEIAAGSGETITCLRLCYEKVHFTAVYNIDNATKYEEKAPLNALVKKMGEVKFL